MKCEYCGRALSKNSPICPYCKRLMSEEQLKIRKELNGANNPYMERLNKLGEEKLKYKLEENVEPKNIKAYLIILAILVGVLILSMFLFR